MAFPSISMIGKDTENPEVTVTGPDDNTWYSKDVTATVTVADPGGSGVDDASAQVFDASGVPIGLPVDFAPKPFPRRGSSYSPASGLPDRLSWRPCRAPSHSKSSRWGAWASSG